MISTLCKIDIPQHHATKGRKILLGFPDDVSESLRVDVASESWSALSRSADVYFHLSLVHRIILGPVVPSYCKSRCVSCTRTPPTMWRSSKPPLHYTGRVHSHCCLQTSALWHSIDIEMEPHRIEQRVRRKRLCRKGCKIPCEQMMAFRYRSERVDTYSSYGGPVS